MQRYFILEKRQLILKKIIQFFTIKPSHKNLNHPKHLSPSFASLYESTRWTIANIPSKYRRTQRTLFLSLSLSLAPNRAPREGESDPRKISLAFTWIPFTWIVSRLLMQRQVDDDVRQSVRSTIRLFHVAVTPSNSPSRKLGSAFGGRSGDFDSFPLDGNENWIKKREGRGKGGGVVVPSNDLTRRIMLVLNDLSLSFSLTLSFHSFLSFCNFI